MAPMGSHRRDGPTARLHLAWVVLRKWLLWGLTGGTDLLQDCIWRGWSSENGSYGVSPEGRTYCKIAFGVGGPQKMAPMGSHRREGPTARLHLAWVVLRKWLLWGLTGGRDLLQDCIWRGWSSENGSYGVSPEGGTYCKIAFGVGGPQKMAPMGS